MHVCVIAVGDERGRGCGIGGVGAESVLVDGARVDTAADGRAARREMYVPGATGAAECPVRCYCRRHRPWRGNASVGTGMPFQTLGENPCAKEVVDASVCGMDGWVKIWNLARRKEGIVQGQECYRGQGEGRGRERRDVSRSPWRKAGKSRGRCASGEEQQELEDERGEMGRWIGSMRDRE